MSTIHDPGWEARNSTDSDSPTHPGNVLQDPDAFIVHTPKDRFKLGYISVMSLVANRMIGSGIFVNSGIIFGLIKSPGVIMLLWTAGVIYATVGTIVYIEFGLSLPRRMVQGRGMALPVEKAVPRSGGDLNYLQYVYSRPAYAKETLHFITAVFGIPFIFFGTMTPNALNFGIRVLQIINPGTDKASENRAKDVNGDHVRIVAIAVTIFAFMIHTLSRRGGIFLNNIFAIIKVGILLLMVVATIVYSVGGFKSLPQPLAAPYDNITSSKNIFRDNFSPKSSFEGASPEIYAYSTAFLDMIFTFSGFEQANYVLGEIGQPHRKFPIGLCISSIGISVLFLIINVCYFIVVPRNVLVVDKNITEAFFILTFGSLSGEPIKFGRRLSDSFLAISALGNIIVMTFTATRVKQEIAKEGILPWPKFFAQNYDLSLGRLLRWLQRRKSSSGSLSWIFRSQWLAPNNFQEETPVGALLLQLVTSLVLIFGTWGVKSAFDTYAVFTKVAAYLINAFFGMLLAVGILYLRLTPSQDWASKSPRVSPKVSIAAASIWLVLNIFPLVVQWVPRPRKQGDPVDGNVHWAVVPAVSVGMLALGAAWWFVLIGLVRRKDRKENTVLIIEKVPEYERYAEDPNDPDGPGLCVQTHETVHIWRKARDYDGFEMVGK